MKNSVVALTFFVIEFVLRFYSRKVFLDYLGTEILGLNTTAVNILQFLSLAELGLGSVMGFALFKPIYDNDERSIVEIISLQRVLYRRIALGIIGGALIVMCFFPYIFSKINIPLWYTYATFLVLLFSSMLGYFYNYKSVVLSSAQMDYKLHLANRPLVMIKTICQIIAVKYSPYPYVFWLVLEVIFAILVTISIQRITYRNFPCLKQKLNNYTLLKDKYHFVIEKMKQTFFHKFAAIVLMQSSPLVIYGYISLSVVAIYGNYMAIINGLSQLVSSVFNSMGAGIGNLIAEGDGDKTIKVFKELFCVRFAIAIILSFGILTLSQPFIVNWIGREYLLPESTLGLITILFFINISRNTVDLFLGGFGMCKDIWAPIVEAVLNLGISITMGYFWGLNGIIGGVIISLIIIVLIWKPIFLFKEGFNVPVKVYMKMYMSMIFNSGVIGFITIFMMRHISIDPCDGWIALIGYASIEIPVFVIAYMGLLYLTQKSVKNFIARFI